MTLEDPRPGDRFRVTFEGTYRAAPGRLYVGPGVGLSWSYIDENATKVERLTPEIVPGALYMDSAGEPYRGYPESMSGKLGVSDWAGNLYGIANSFPPGLRRARLVAEDD